MVPEAIGSSVDKPFVLIVDDNEATVTLVAALLRREFEIESAIDGADAVAKLKTKRYAAVLLDLLMPHVNGFEVLDFLKEHQPDVLARVIVLTAALGKPGLDRAIAYGICGVIPKPFEIEILVNAVRNCAGPDDERRLGTLFSSSVIIFLAD